MLRLRQLQQVGPEQLRKLRPDAGADNAERHEKAGLREPLDRNGSGRRYGGDLELEWKIYYYREQLERQ